MARKKKNPTMDTREDLLYLFKQVEKMDDVYEKYMIVLKARYELLIKTSLENDDFETALVYKQEYIEEEAAAQVKYGTHERLSVQEVSEVLLMLLKNIGIGLHNADMSKIARFMGYITRYSPESIRKYLRNRTPCPKCERILTFNRLLTILGFKELVVTK